jgi:endonuclease/exonuclease/phosphatase family metal-dependent hydrolase
VTLNAVARTGEPDVICLGDFNADGLYFDETTYDSVLPAATYRWLFDNTLDTTVAPSANTYDRMVTLSATDEDFTGRAGVFRFDEALSLGSLSATDVSDHYPIWAEFWSGRDSD